MLIGQNINQHSLLRWQDSIMDKILFLLLYTFFHFPHFLQWTCMNVREKRKAKKGAERIRGLSCMLSRSVVSSSFTTPWTTACQPTLLMEFFRQGYWSRLPFLIPGDFPDPGIKSMSPASPAGGFFTHCTTWGAQDWVSDSNKCR